MDVPAGGAHGGAWHVVACTQAWAVSKGCTAGCQPSTSLLSTPLPVLLACSQVRHCGCSQNRRSRKGFTNRCCCTRCHGLLHKNTIESARDFAAGCKGGFQPGVGIPLMTVSYRARCRKPGSRDCGKALMPEKLCFVQLSATTSTSAYGLSAKTKGLHTALDANLQRY